ncbi:hypothetical protein NFJ02_23g53210 [Pycnococcus provasolii]
MATYVALWERCFGGAAGSRQPYLFELDPADTSSSAMTAWLDDMLNIVGIRQLVLSICQAVYARAWRQLAMLSALTCLASNTLADGLQAPPLSYSTTSTLLFKPMLPPVFFGHLLPALSHPAAAAGPAAPRGAPHGAAGGV